MNLSIRITSVLAAILFASGCTHVPPLYEHPGTTLWSEGRISPELVVLVGRIVSNTTVGRPHPLHDDKYITIQLYRVKIAVENVLQGVVPKGEIEVYYFARCCQPYSGPPPLGFRGVGGKWPLGGYVLFLLQRDAGVLRTVCDLFASCAPNVLTGPHPGFKAKPNEPLPAALVDLLLSRGRGCTDKMIIAEIESPDAWGYSLEECIKRLQPLATEESPEVRKAACKELFLLAATNRRPGLAPASCGPTPPDFAFPAPPQK